MFPLERKIDLFSKSALAERDTILYLAEKLYDVTNNDKPDNDDLKKSYYEARNLAILLKEKISDLGDDLCKVEESAGELLKSTVCSD